MRLGRVSPLYWPSTPNAVAVSRSQSESRTGAWPSCNRSVHARWLNGESNEIP